MTDNGKFIILSDETTIYRVTPREITCFNRENGRRLWETKLEKEIGENFSATQDPLNLYILRLNLRKYSKRDGEELWTAQTTRSPFTRRELVKPTNSINPNQLIFVLSEEGEPEAYNPSDGRRIP